MSDKLSAVKHSILVEKKFRIKLNDKQVYSGCIGKEGIGAGIYGPRTKRSVPMVIFHIIFQAAIYAICLCV